MITSGGRNRIDIQSMGMWWAVNVTGTDYLACESLAIYLTSLGKLKHPDDEVSEEDIIIQEE